MTLLFSGWPVISLSVFWVWTWCRDLRRIPLVSDGHDRHAEIGGDTEEGQNRDDSDRSYPS